MNAVEHLIQDMNWDKIERVFESLDWTYPNELKAERPTRERLQEVARECLVTAMMLRMGDDLGSCASGGFVGLCDRHGNLDLFFVPDSASIERKEVI